MKLEGNVLIFSLDDPDKPVMSASLKEQILAFVDGCVGKMQVRKRTPNAFELICLTHEEDLE